MPSLTTILIISALPVLLYLYVRHNDKKIMRLPAEMAAISAERFTPEAIRATARDLAADPVDITSALPPKTGRRYIVVGGGGFLGGWIVTHLLKRGEDPKHIRIVDIRPPTHFDLQTGLANDIEFVQADISDADSVRAAFTKHWSGIQSPEPEVTVFNTAASIRFYERDISLVPLSAKVNVIGAKNVVDASRACGATILCTTSSGSVGVRNTRFLLAPWEKEPKHFVQIIRDDDDHTSKPHNHFFSNYAYTKYQGEQLVRSADRSVGTGGKVLRTGCIRPGNGIYGIGDFLCEFQMKTKNFPTWVPDVCHSFVHVENCSLAHLCYEQRLLELSQGSTNPDIGGKAFAVSDAGPPVTYNDSYIASTVLTDGKCAVIYLSSTAMLLLAHVVEPYYLFVNMLNNSTSSPLKILSYFFPRVKGNLLSLQPSMWALVNVHLAFDNSRAMAPPEKGGLGYNPLWTSLMGMCQLVEDFKKNERRAKGNGHVSGVKNVERSIQRGLKAVEGFGIDPKTTLN